MTPEEEEIEEVLKSAVEDPPASVRRRAFAPGRADRPLVVPLAAAVFLAGTLLALFFVPTSDNIPTDTSPRQEKGPLEKLVERWLAGEDLEDRIYELGRKALPALQPHAREEKVAHVIGRIEARPPRVLYIEGPPRYEYRYLKNAMIRDRNLLVHVVLTTADEGWPAIHFREADEPRFRNPIKNEVPATLDELLGYDVIIIGDVAPDRLPGKVIEEFVREYGGGLICIAGQQHNPESYAGTPLGNLYPLARAESSGDDLGYALTEAGRNHPITKSTEWDKLPAIRWIYAAKDAGEADVLVLAGQHPLFAVRRAGRGRVFWSATDETWLWRYKTGDEPHFYPFHRAVIDYLAGEVR